MNSAPNYSEFVGVSPRTAALIETFRQSEDEPKDTIIYRALSSIPGEVPACDTEVPGILDLGEGAKAVVGERLFLFLSKKSKETRKPEGFALVGATGISVGNKVFPRRHGFLHEAMKAVQNQRGHRNSDGEIVSLSAWRQWHVQRGDKMVRLFDLKDPALAKRRGNREPWTLEELGL